MRTAPHGLRPALVVVLALVLATGCKDDKDSKAPAGSAGPAIEGTVQPDPVALRHAVDQAVAQKLADDEAARIGGKDRGDAARLRTAEARMARLDERLDALERKSTSPSGLRRPGADEPAVGGPSTGRDRGVDAPPTVEPEPEPEPKPEPKPEPDVVEAPAEDLTAEPAETDGELTLGFHPAPLPEDGEDAPEPTLILTRAAVAPSIDRDSREPVDAGTVFDASVGKLYAFMVFKNPTEEEHQVTVVWKLDGKEQSRLPDLKVGPKASRWRTWAYLTINDRRRGDWAVEIEGPDAVLLGSVNFRVE
ncbi:MAG: DUF2914 domain-containing protein [Pseudomonadota bacterium]